MMTEEELKALIGDMDRRGPIAPRAERIVPAQSARTPSMLVREAMMRASVTVDTREDADDRAGAGASGATLHDWSADDAADTDADDVHDLADDGRDDAGPEPLMLRQPVSDAAERAEAAAWAGDDEAEDAGFDGDWAEDDQSDDNRADDDTTEDATTRPGLRLSRADADAWAGQADEDADQDDRSRNEDAEDHADEEDWSRDDDADHATPAADAQQSLRVSHADTRAAAWAHDADDDSDDAAEDDDDWADAETDADDLRAGGDGAEDDPADAPRERVSLRLPRPERPRADRTALRDRDGDDDGEGYDGGFDRTRSRGVTPRRSEVAPDAPRATVKDDAPRKPRIMLMGEFSAGKSTLMNLLLGEPALPVNATATQLPPVWITKGSDAQPMRVDLEGYEEPVDLAAPGIPLSDTHYIRLQKTADLLDICDLIDTPGISDPNMPAEIWQRMIQHADIVIWCTHATQAWRQSEAAAWALMPQKLQSRSLLLLTRFDKVANDRDRIRVLKRVRSETDTLFRDIFPISLTEAIAAGDDKDAFAAAGGESFADALFEVIGLIQRRDATVRTRPRSQLAPFRLDPEPEQIRVITPRRVRPRPLAARPLGSRPGAVGDRN